MGDRVLADGRYALLELLGTGGMGRVYRARDRAPGGQEEEVAVKVLHEAYAESEEFVGRFKREAENAASLSHPNIVRVYDRGPACGVASLAGGGEGTPYMAMEYVAGGTLKQRILREGSLAPEEAVRIALGIAEALKAAHGRGIVHRDIKPHNVFLTEDGEVKVGDFGIAKAAEATAFTETSLILGTARYLSPEQAKGERVGPASDLYSLGIVLYEMLTGRVPFEADSAVAIALKQVTVDPPSLREAAPAVRVPGCVEAVTLRLLRKEPKERYRDAAGLTADLQRVRQQLRRAPAGAEEAATEAIVRAPAAKKTTARTPVRGVPRRGRSRLLSLPVAGGLLLALLIPTGYAALSDKDALLGSLEEAAKGVWSDPQGDPQNASQGASQDAPSRADEGVLGTRASSSTPDDASVSPAPAQDKTGATTQEEAVGDTQTSSAKDSSQGSGEAPGPSASLGSSAAIALQGAQPTATHAFSTPPSGGNISTLKPAPPSPAVPSEPQRPGVLPSAPQVDTGQRSEPPSEQPSGQPAPAGRQTGSSTKGPESTIPSPASSAAPEAPVTQSPSAGSDPTAGAGASASGVHASTKSTPGQKQVVQDTSSSQSR